MLKIDQPDGGNVLRGTFDVSGTAEDESQTPVKVDLLLDSQVIDSNDAVPLAWSFRVNTADYEDGPHQLEVRATDQAMNSTSVKLSVITEQLQLPTCPAGVWLMQYWTNMTMSGGPTFARCVSAPVDYSWGYQGPEGATALDSFSVSWMSTQTFEKAGMYEFTATADDGIRVWVDNDLIIDEWRGQYMTTFTKRKRLPAGDHVIRVEYFEETEVAICRVSWEKGE